MPAKKTSVAMKTAELSAEDQARKDKVDLLVRDLEIQTEKLIKDKEREVEAAATSITTMYKVALMSIPDHIKNAPWDSFMKTTEGQISALNVSLEVEAQVSQVTSAIKSTRKPRKAALANTAVRASARKRNMSADRNLETPASSRNHNRRNVMETPQNLNPAKTPLMTPMITPKFDTSQLTKTARRMVRENEIAVSLNGSPVMPYINPRSKAAKTARANLAQVPLAGGQTLNLPMDGFELEGDSVDDEQLRQLEELTKNLQKSVANIKANRGKEN